MLLTMRLNVINIHDEALGPSKSADGEVEIRHGYLIIAIIACRRGRHVVQPSRSRWFV